MLYAHIYIYVHIYILVCLPGDRKAYTIILPTNFEHQQRQLQSCQTASHRPKLFGILVHSFLFSFGPRAAVPSDGRKPKAHTVGADP